MMSDEPKISLVDAPRCRLGEGIRYDVQDETLTWVDIPASLVHSLGGNGVLTSEVPCEEVAFSVRLSCGGWLAGGAHGLVSNGMRGKLVPPGMSPQEVLNDGAVHPSGRALIFGSRDRNEILPTGKMWVLGEHWVEMPWQFTVFNGPAYSPDGRIVYFADSPTGIIWEAGFDIESLTLGSRTVFSRVPEKDGYPDGMCCDNEGYLWSAHWDGARVTRYRPDGTVERIIHLPVGRVTSVAFFGADLDQLAVTTAQPDESDCNWRSKDSLAGNVLCFSANTKGQPSARLDDAIVRLSFDGDTDVQSMP